MQPYFRQHCSLVDAVDPHHSGPDGIHGNSFCILPIANFVGQQLAIYVQVHQVATGGRYGHSLGEE